MSARMLSPALRDDYLALLDGWPLRHDRRTIDTCEGETFVLSCGRTDAPPLVLLHGALTNAASWLFDAEIWSRDFRVHVVDVIGEPGLSAPSHPPLDSDGWAAWLDDVLDGLGVTSAAFVGMSFGGWIALDYACRRPTRVSRLALLCPSGIGPQKAFLWKALPLLLLGSWGAAKVRAMVMGPSPKASTPQARRLLDFLQRVRTGVRPRPMRLPIVSDEALSALPMPLLVIVGGRDVMLDSRVTRQRVMTRVPRGRVHFVEDGRHYLPHQAGTIQAFLHE
ncbi:MAG: putative carboxylesterase nap [Luteibacter sp.]|uniref:alpha/beta fold hydrolase n=1 Tax=Luteibacter sp. TaxID=1886636 RepID=UPI0013822A9D|nr:alpha/beta fold hydrolase [Luteibacter sp.]KAF1005179.1 MAG: putative carboxylesterase nap [Luteibacter sp.]